MSLINQELVSREAERLRVRVDSGLVDEAIKEWNGLDVSRRSLERSGEIDALRARFEAFPQLKQVKTLVVGKVNISDDQVRTAYESQVNLQAYALEEVADVLRGRLADKEVERRWPRGWTASGNAPGSKYSTQRLAWRTRRRHRAAARTHEGFRVMEGSLRTLARCATLALVLAACGPEGRTFVPGSEMLPGPGYFHIEGDPIVAEMTLTFRYIGSDGVVSQVKDTIQPGGQTVVDRTTLPGSHRLTLNAFPCSGSFAVETDRETDLLVRITAEGCEISIVRVHEVGEVTH